MKIGFVSTYLPTNCGIAKFTNSLEESLRLYNIQIYKIRMIVPEDTPINGIFVNIRKYEEEDYIKAAELINRSDLDLVCLQHEYGIFGGEFGDYIIKFIEHLKKPLITVFHTLEYEYPEYARRIIKEIWYKSNKVIITLPDMHHILKDKFGIEDEQLYKYVHIPHGVPVVDISKKGESKKRLNIDRYLLISFGLLKPDKGLEYAIEALTYLKEDLIYLIIGKDHPESIKKYGYSYLQLLKDKVRELSLEKQVRFIEKFFANEEELSSYLLAGDILLTPYLGLNRVSSGVIVYGMAHGMCIITTPFIHAKKDINDDIGRIVKEKDSKSIADAINSLLHGDIAYMQKMAYEHVKDRQWPRIAEYYFKIFKTINN